ncbi:MAG: glycosyltransferase family 4 protein [Halothiobacillus sp.]|nr:glycosyltransferase family 4 protein [Halothiobacillus sp.]
MKVAIVHDWLTTVGGAEHVLAELLSLFPQAELFTVVDTLPLQYRSWLEGHAMHTSFIQRMPFGRENYRRYLPLMPLAVEQFDLRGFDLILSSSHAVAKGVLVGPDQLHISYVHSPMRYAWDMQHAYLEEAGLTKGIRGLFSRIFLHQLRLWDSRTANGVDHFIANSRFIARRIEKAYRRKAEVIYPPVDTTFFTPDEGKREDFYITASRLVPYKRIDLLIETFRDLPGRRLIIAGEGPEGNRLRRMAPPNVEFIGRCDREQLRQLMRQARAFLYAAEEDFGIVIVEAQACGCPIIAYGRGGATETVIAHGQGFSRCPHPDPGATGLLYHEQNCVSLKQAIMDFEENMDAINPAQCRTHAESFSREHFRDRIQSFIQAKLQAWQDQL